METINDIVPEMREFADTDSQLIGRDVLRREIQHFADRLDSAYKHEVGVSKKETTIGNNAKMFEALNRIVEHARYASEIWQGTHMAQIVAWGKAGLSAPPRNCDKFVDELDAQIKFLNDVWQISVAKGTMLESDEFENWTEEMKSRYTKWLFAEAKGEN